MSRTAAATVTAAAFALLAACAGLAPPGTPEAPRAQTSSAADARARCAATAATQLPRVRLADAQWVEASTDAPAHCRLQGRIDERTGSDGERHHTAIELLLPQTWAGRLLHLGSGDEQPLAGSDDALTRGYAVVRGDSGHAGGSASFGLDAQARVDHAWRGPWRAATVARELLVRHYGRAPQRSYFVGCGEGGRQGMMFTQRFPLLYDGVVAVAPAMSGAMATAIAAAWTAQQMATVAPRDARGAPLLAHALAPAQLDRVAAEVLDRCDAADGLVDGFVADTALCRIDLRRLRCPAAGEGCLSEPQARALAEVMAGARARGGARLAFGQPWDPGIAAPQWRAWVLGEAGAPGVPALLPARLSPLLGLVYTTPPDPTLGLLNFDFDRDPQRLRTYHLQHGTAADVTLAGFVARAGRLLFVQGMADPLVSAHGTVDYQQRLDAAHGAGAAARFARTFLVPGMNHCRGGPATDRYDALGALVAWVEAVRPRPRRVDARGTVERPGLERPLCPYPKIARYRGSGDTSLASSFECR